MRRFGVVQGRLISSPPGQLQWFPQERWEEEFEFARVLGFSYLELIAERQHNPQNPLWSDAGVQRILELNEENGLDAS
jgi:sugar phosphate isomerase/epimerase